MSKAIDRRTFLGAAAGAGAAALAAPAQAQAAPEKKWQQGASPWPLVLNASTVRPLPVREKVRVAAEAGWDGIELWMQDLEAHEKDGGDLKELAREINDCGLYVNNIIGLWGCMPAAAEDWEAQLPTTREMMRRCMEVGAQGVAALPFPDREDFCLKDGASKYAELMRIGREDYNLRVAFEFIGFIKGVHRLGQATAVAVDANDRQACLIMDTFHLYRGGSGFNGLRHLAPEFMWDFHWNDVPTEPGQFELRDRDRIYPGDGILPLNQALRDLHAIGYTGPLSLELFSEALWAQCEAGNGLSVSKEGLEKMRANIAAAGV